MAAFQKITGFKKIGFCKRCNTKMINPKPSMFYCDPCLVKLRKH